VIERPRPLRHHARARGHAGHGRQEQPPRRPVTAGPRAAGNEPLKQRKRRCGSRTCLLAGAACSRRRAPPRAQTVALPSGQKVKSHDRDPARPALPQYTPWTCRC
jgi:hypothetical protein